MSVLYMSRGMAPSFQGHGTSTCPFPLLRSSLTLLQRTAKVWINFQLVHDLVGHAQPVWAVVAMGGDEYLTGALLLVIARRVFPLDHPFALGSADKTIKLWRQHKCLRTYHGHKDAVRSLALLTDIGFASGSNDRFVHKSMADPVLTLCPQLVKLQYGRLKGT